MQRELASQIFEVVQYYAGAMREAGSPSIRALLCIGGLDVREQLNQLRKYVDVRLVWAER